MTCDAAYFIDYFSTSLRIAFIRSNVENDVFDRCVANIFHHVLLFDGTRIELWNVGSILL